MKYAVKVIFDNDWMYVTEYTRHCIDLVPRIFENEEDAENFANTWRLEGKADNVKVVEYGNA